MRSITIALFFISFLVLQVAKAQDDLPTGEVRIEKDAEIKLVDFDKLRFAPSGEVEPPKRNYQITLDQKVYKVEYEAPEIKAKGLRRERPMPSYSSYLKLGAGLPSSYVGEAAVSLPVQDQSIFNAAVDYFSINDKSYEHRQGSKFDGNFGIESSLENDMILNGNLLINYANHSLYGYDHEDTSYVWDKEIHRNIFQQFGLNGGISQVTDSENPFEYEAKLGFYQWRNQAEQIENTPTLDARVYKWFGDFSFGLDLDADWTKSKRDTMNLDFTKIDIIPQVRYHMNSWYVDGGANLSYYRDEFTVYPKLEAGFNLAGAGLQVYGGLSGEATPMTMKRLTDENPFFASELNIVKFQETSNFYGGIKGNVSNVVYNAELGYMRINDLPIFLDVTVDRMTRFIATTDTANLFYFKGVADLKLSSEASLTTGITYNAFDMKNVSQAYYMPPIKADIGLSWSFMENRFRATTDFSFASTVKSPIEIESTERKVNSMYNLDFGLEGFVTENFGFFIDINNVLNNRYARFTDYQSVGLNVQLGLSARF